VARRRTDHWSIAAEVRSWSAKSEVKAGWKGHEEAIARIGRQIHGRGRPLMIRARAETKMVPRCRSGWPHTGAARGLSPVMGKPTREPEQLRAMIHCLNALPRKTSSDGSKFAPAPTSGVPSPHRRLQSHCRSSTCAQLPASSSSFSPCGGAGSWGRSGDSSRNQSLLGSAAEGLMAVGLNAAAAYKPGSVAGTGTAVLAPRSSRAPGPKSALNGSLSMCASSDGH